MSKLPPTIANAKVLVSRAIAPKTAAPAKKRSEAIPGLMNTRNLLKQDRAMAMPKKPR